jgi:uncharacterized protein (DUF2249 family)
MSPDLDIDEPSSAYEQIESHLADVSADETITISADGDADLDVILTRYQIEHGGRLDWEAEGSLYHVEALGSLDDEQLDFDVRSIPPQRRHEVLTGTFANLDPGRGFVLVNDHDPKPLYHELRSIHGEVVGWEYESRGGDEGWRVRIEKTEQSREQGSDVHTEFDVREIPKPERHDTIHHRYGMMPDDETMEIVAPHEPRPLHQEFVDRYGTAFDWQVVDKQPGEVTVHITKQESGDASGEASTEEGPAPEVTEELDVRSLPPAQRHEQIFDAYEGLERGEGFVLVNDHDPKPLYHQFNAEAGEQFHWEYRKQSPGEFRVLIGKSEGVGHTPDLGGQSGHGHGDGHGHGGGGHNHDHGHSCGHEEEDSSAPF